MAERLPNRVKELIDERSWGVRDVAERCALSSSTVHRLSTGEAHLRQYDMRELGKAFGVKPSALLPPEDVEFRPDEFSAGVIAALASIPPQDQADLLKMAARLVDIARGAANDMNTAARRIAGSAEILGAFADVWNPLDDDTKSGVVELVRAAGFRR